jgi:hypothetical protein
MRHPPSFDFARLLCPDEMTAQAAASWRACSIGPAGRLLVGRLHPVGEGLAILDYQDLNSLLLQKREIGRLACDRRLRLRVSGGLSGGADDLLVFASEFLHECLEITNALGVL